MKIPTFVSALDTIINGGVPSGSSILLLGEAGAGGTEFAITSAVKHSRAIDGIIPKELQNKEIDLLDGILYVTFSKPASEIMRVIELTMQEDIVRSLKSRIKIVDLSTAYYAKTQIPNSWIGGPRLREKEDLIGALVSALDRDAPGKMIILDSLSDLITSKLIDEKSLFDLARGVSRAVKKWNSLLYAIMATEITDTRNENILIDIFDGTMLFRWNTSERYSRRRRFMVIPKFIGVLPQIEQEKIERFDTDFDYKSGMIVLNTTKVK